MRNQDKRDIASITFYITGKACRTYRFKTLQNRAKAGATADRIMKARAGVRMVRCWVSGTNSFI